MAKEGGRLAVTRQVALRRPLARIRNASRRRIHPRAFRCRADTATSLFLAFQPGRCGHARHAAGRVATMDRLRASAPSPLRLGLHSTAASGNRQHGPRNTPFPGALTTSIPPSSLPVSLMAGFPRETIRNPSLRRREAGCMMGFADGSIWPRRFTLPALERHAKPKRPRGPSRRCAAGVTRQR